MKVAQLEIELIAEISRLRKDLRDAGMVTERETRTMQDHVRRLGMAFAAMGSAAAAGLAVMVKNTINTMDETSKLAQQLGLTVEKLSALQYVADQSGVSVQQLSTVFVRLNRMMGDAQRGVESASRGFRALGISVIDSTGRLRDNDAVLLDIADAFSQMEDGATKTALAYEILGRSGAVMIPFLNAGRKGIQELREEAERLGLTFSTETAQAAERFNDTLTRIDRARQGFVRGLTGELLPALTAMASAIEALSRHIDVFAKALGAIALIGFGRVIGTLTTALAAKTAAFVAATREAMRQQAALARMAGVSASAAAGITALGAAARAASGLLAVLGGPVGLIASLGLAGAAFFAMSRDADAASLSMDGLSDKLAGMTEAQLLRTQSNLLDQMPELIESMAEAGRQIQFIEKTMKDLEGRAGVTAQEMANLRKEHMLATAESDDLSQKFAELTRMLDEVAKFIARLRGGVAGATADFADLNDQLIQTSDAARSYMERLEDQALTAGLTTARARLEAMIDAGKLVFSEEDLARVRAAADRIDSVGRSASAAAPRISEAQRAVEEFARARDADIASQYQQISAIHQNAEAMELENQVYGEARYAIEELHIARLEEQAAVLSGFGGSKQQIELIESEIKARQRLIAAMQGRDELEAREAARQAEQRARDEYLREWARTNEMVGQSLTDSLLRGFEDGIGFAENFRRTLKNMFQTMVLRPIIQPVVQQAAGTVTSALGLGGSAPGSGVPPGMGNLFSGLGQAISGASVGASGLSLGVANLAGRLGGDALGTLISMNAGWSGVGGAAGGLAGAAGAAMSAIGSALPWIGAGITAYSLLKDAFSGETRYGAGYGIGHEGIAIRSGGPSGGDPQAEQTARAIEQTWTSLHDLVGRLGGSLAGWTMGAGWELSPEKGRSFVWTDLVAPGEFVSHTEGIGRRDLSGVKDGNVVAQEFATELQRTLIRGLQLADVDEHWREWIDQFDVDQLDEAGVQSVVAMIDALVTLQQSALDMNMASLANATAQAQANIIELSGGIENFSSNLSTYYQAFYSEAERTANLQATLTRVVGELGYELPRTHAGFRDLVESLDLSTESGQQAYATLIGISGAFDQLVQSLDSVGGTVDAAFSQQLGVVREMAQETNRLLGARNRAGNLLDRINRNTGFAGQREAELWAAMSTASYEQQIELAAELTDIVLSRYNTEIQAAQRLQDMGRSLRDYLSSLATSELAPTDLATKVAEAERQLNEAVAKARRGDEDAMAQIQGLTQNALELWRRYGASGDAYQDAYYRITGSVGDLADAAMSDAQRQLSVSQESLDQLEQLRGVAETAYAAIDAQYQASLEGLQNETSILTELGEQTGRLNEMGDILRGIPAEIAAHLQPIMSGAINNAVSGLYTGTGITPDQSAVDYWGGQLATQPASVVSGDFYRTLVDNWYKDYLGWSGDLQGINYWADQVEKIGAQKAFEDFAREAGIPGYAMGGLASGLSLVGERGPELVDFTNPGRVYSNDVLANVMRRVTSPDANSSALVAEVKALREEVKALREQNNMGHQANVNATVKTGDKIADATERGVHAAALAR